MVVACPVAEGLPGGLDGFIGREHDGLDGRIEFLELLQQFNAGHAGHEDIQHGDMDFIFADALEGGDAIARKKDVVFVLEDNFQRLPRAVLVINDQQRRLVRPCGSGFLRSRNGIQRKW